MNTFEKGEYTIGVSELREPGAADYLALHALSQQGHIIRSTPRDHAERFASLRNFTEWQSSRVLYLMKIGEATAGLAWFHRVPRDSPIEIPSSFAIRVYEPYVGKGLALPFMSVAHGLVSQDYGVRSFWLGVNSDNMAARKLYETYGYNTAATIGQRITMIYDRSIDE